MRAAYDVVVAGGGAMGSATAFWLKTLSPKLKVAVVERDPTYKRASTGLSVGSFRQQFSLSENIQLSMFSSKFLKHDLPSALAINNGELVDISLVEGGYLLLASNGGQGEASMRESHREQMKHQAKVRLLTPPQLQEQFPWLNVEGLALGSHGYANEGWFDPYALLYAFKQKCVQLGVEYMTDEVVGFDLGPGKIHHVQLKQRGRVGCGWVVHATGPWAAETASLAGVLNFPVRPRKRAVFQFHCPSAPLRFPLTVDPTGMYFRSDGPANYFLCGMSPSLEEPDPDWDSKLDPELRVDDSLFYDRLWPLLAHRVPAFEQLKLKSSWAGLYEYNTLDQNSICGPHPELSNLLFANGFSGHGIQQSPAVGLALAELVVYNQYRTIDLTRLGYSRIAKHEPLWERCIV
ncbi:hypothetical protein BASA81_002318 [Batrachochytrium salamandrivorans]|nr:hypothetical protein BASA81_002318 [Batrachochytrium salamandrivorans]